jgi:hypothetical protein
MPVQGKVSIDGKPMPCGAVVFVPDVASGNANGASAQAPIGKDGSYELITNGQKGAALGKYRVVIYLESPGGPPPPKGLTIAAKYANAATTDLWIEVVETPSPGAYDLKISH